MESEDKLENYHSRPFTEHLVEYLFDDMFSAYRFIDDWQDKISVDECVWFNDDGSYSVMVNTRA